MGGIKKGSSPAPRQSRFAAHPPTPRAALILTPRPWLVNSKVVTVTFYQCLPAWAACHETASAMPVPVALQQAEGGPGPPWLHCKSQCDTVPVTVNRLGL